MSFITEALREFGKGFVKWIIGIIIFILVIIVLAYVFARDIPFV